MSASSLQETLQLRKGQQFKSYREVNKAIERHKQLSAVRLSLKKAVKLGIGLSPQELQQVNRRLKYSELLYRCIFTSAKPGRPGNDERCPKIIQLTLNSDGKTLDVIEAHTHEPHNMANESNELTDHVTQVNHSPMIINEGITVTPIVPTLSSPLSNGNTSNVVLLNSSVDNKSVNNGTTKKDLVLPSKNITSKCQGQNLSHKNDSKLATISPVDDKGLKLVKTTTPNPLSLNELENFSKKFKPIAPKLSTKKLVPVKTNIRMGSQSKAAKKTHGLMKSKPVLNKQHDVIQKNKLNNPVNAKITQSNLKKSLLSQNTQLLNRPKTHKVLPVKKGLSVSQGNSPVATVKVENKKLLLNRSQSSLCGNSQKVLVNKEGHLVKVSSKHRPSVDLKRPEGAICTMKKPSQNGLIRQPMKMNLPNGTTGAVSAKLILKKKPAKLTPNENTLHSSSDTELPFADKQQHAHNIVLQLLRATSQLPMKDFTYALDTLQTITDAFQLGHRVTVNLKKERDDSFHNLELYDVQYESDETRVTSLSKSQVDGQCNSDELLKQLDSIVLFTEAAINNQPGPAVMQPMDVATPRRRAVKRNRSDNVTIKKRGRF